MSSELYSIVSSMRHPKILVVGDIILDRHVIGNIERVSPESPAQVLDMESEALSPGGAASVSANVSALGGKALLVGVVGKDDSAVYMKTLLKKWGIGAEGLVTDSSRPTTVKTRFIAMRQQMLRVDRESREVVSDKTADSILSKIKKLIKDCDGVIVSDYGKGVLSPRLLKKIFSVCRQAGKKVIVDPKGRDYSRYSGAEIITPNKKEAEAASGVEITNEASLLEAANNLFNVAKVKNVLITRGAEGMSLFGRKGKRVHIPAEALEVFDVSGAGDTVIASLAVFVFAGCSLEDSARIANAAAAIEVAHVGAYAVTREELLARLRPDGASEGKIMSATKAALCSKKLKMQNRKVIFTNGCFDLLHAGHVKLLQKAKTFGHVLIVGINTDSSIRRLKGAKRPVLGEEDRSHIIAALDSVDGVVLFDEDTPLKLIGKVKPDVLVKGGDYAPSSVVGRDVVEKQGGRVEIIPLVDGKSTSGLIEKILEKYGD